MLEYDITAHFQIKREFINQIIKPFGALQPESVTEEHRNVKAVPVRATKVYGGRRGTAPLILKLDTVLEVKGQLHVI